MARQAIQDQRAEIPKAKIRRARREADEKVEAVQRGHLPAPGSVPTDVEEQQERPPKPEDPDEIEVRQRSGEDLRGFLFPGHHRVSGGWDGPDD